MILAMMIAEMSGDWLPQLAKRRGSCLDIDEIGFLLSCLRMELRVLVHFATMPRYGLL